MDPIAYARHFATTAFLLLACALPALAERSGPFLRTDGRAAGGRTCPRPR
jgi:hypothetical protein